MAHTQLQQWQPWTDQSVSAVMSVCLFVHQLALE